MKEKILVLLSVKGDLSAAELTDELGISRQMVHRLLNTLQEENVVQKLGRSPRTYYRLKATQQQTPEASHNLAQEEADFLQDHFMIITETGQRLDGEEAMAHWCRRQKLPFAKTVDEFIATRKKYLQYFLPNNLISGIEKLRNTDGLGAIGLDEMYYLDFYAIERFGKTKLGTLLHFAKQGQNKKLMKELSEMVRPTIVALLETSGAAAVGYIPPTVKREVQLMQVLQKNLNLAAPHIGILKLKGDITIPQKALSKLQDRIGNARASFVVTEKRNFETVLLIDDALGSGATINETALKLKAKGVGKKVIGLAITGSYKGFEVIQEI